MHSRAAWSSAILARNGRSESRFSITAPKASPPRKPGQPARRYRWLLQISRPRFSVAVLLRPRRHRTTRELRLSRPLLDLGQKERPPQPASPQSLRRLKPNRDRQEAQRVRRAPPNGPG